MNVSPKAIFHQDARYEGILRINIYLLRLLYILMFFVLGKILGRMSSRTAGHGSRQMPWHGAFGRRSPLWQA